MTCLSCRGIGCSACQRTYTMGRITFDPAPPTHTCPQCMRGLPCPPVDSSSLSALVGAAATYRTEAAFKADAFPTPEVQ